MPSVLHKYERAASGHVGGAPRPAAVLGTQVHRPQAGVCPGRADCSGVGTGEPRAQAGGLRQAEETL